jgi:hypothetical protein
MPNSGIRAYCNSPWTSNLFVFSNIVFKAICKALFHMLEDVFINVTL